MVGGGKGDAGVRDKNKDTWLWLIWSGVCTILLPRRVNHVKQTFRVITNHHHHHQDGRPAFSPLGQVLFPDGVKPARSTWKMKRLTKTVYGRPHYKATRRLMKSICNHPIKKISYHRLNNIPGNHQRTAHWCDWTQELESKVWYQYIWAEQCYSCNTKALALIMTRRKKLNSNLSLFKISATMLEENTKPPRAIAGPANLCTANLGFMDNTISVRPLYIYQIQVSLISAGWCGVIVDLRSRAPLSPSYESYLHPFQASSSIHVLRKRLLWPQSLLDTIATKTIEFRWG